MRVVPKAVAAIVTGLLFACAAHAQTRIEQIGDHKVELRRIDAPAARATVVFENGARLTLDTWDKVIDGIKGDVNVFAYNRPGYGNSDDVKGPRDGSVVVGELRAALRRQGLQPPYVLVGHSLGGLYMQLYARSYPDEVRALVLVDSVYPGIVKKTEEFPLATRIAKRLILSSALNREIDDIHRTGEALLALPVADRIPVERLINVPKSPGAKPLDLGIFNGGPALRARIEALYPHARTTIVDSSHRIQVTTPEAVVAAIRRAIAASAIAVSAVVAKK